MWIFGILLLCAGEHAVRSAEPVVLHPNSNRHEAKQGDMYSVFCEAPSATSIAWYYPNNTYIAENRLNDIYVEKDDKGVMLQLRFQRPQLRHSGQYTCVAKINNHDESKSFNLTVIKPITFADKTKEFYATVGGNATLLCEVDSYPASEIVWMRNDTKLEGPDYRILADGLYVANVDENKLGNYTCQAIMYTSLNSEQKSINLVLKLAKPPTIKSIYKNDTVIGVMNTLTNIKCIVTSDPSADIKWFRNGKELSMRDYNATIQNKDNESILQLYLSNRDFLGEYTCKAIYSLNQSQSTSYKFTLVQGTPPDPPTVQIRERRDKNILLDINANSSLEMNSYRVLYKKANEANTSEWQTIDFEPKDVVSTNPYSINDLEPNTVYLYKVGACTQIDLCTFTNESDVSTEPLSTNSAIIHTLATQMFILLPAFVLNFVTKRT